MLFGKKRCEALVVVISLICLSGCNDPDERKTHYVTVYLSQDVEIKDILVDTGMKKPGIHVVHPEGVESTHRPTKPKKSVSFDQLPLGVLALLFFFLLMQRRSPENYSVDHDTGLSSPSTPFLTSPRSITRVRSANVWRRAGLDSVITSVTSWSVSRSARSASA